MESINDDKIQKTLVTPGIGGLPTFSNGTKVSRNKKKSFSCFGFFEVHTFIIIFFSQVSFHFVTRIVGSNIVVDDSYKWPKHMEIVLGKKFKLEVWETILKSMREREISKFIVHKSVSIPFF